MAKAKTMVYFCQNCGFESAKWMGQCPACHEWNSFVEEPAAGSSAPKAGTKATAGVVQWGSLGIDRKSGADAASSSHAQWRSRGEALPLKEIRAEDSQRVSTGISEMDRVLGGGIVPGSLVLVGGDPGIGKSTLLLQVCRNLTLPGVQNRASREPEPHNAESAAQPGLQNGGSAWASGRREAMKVLYVSGEESQQQIKLRANRMGEFGDTLLLLCETNLSEIQEAIARLQPHVVIIDSIQTMYNESVSSAPGSVSQVRETT